ncbi:MAG: DUF1573 domain-containing protein [Planctomycetota bacterium]
MKKPDCVVAILAAVLAPAVAQQPAAPGPRMELSQQQWNYGEIWDSEKPQITLRISNGGQAELEIKNVSAACSCTVLELPRKTIAPGQSIDVPITFDPRGKQGPYGTYINIATNDPATPEFSFKIAGTVKRAVLMEPLGGVYLRTVDAKAGQTPKPVRLKNVLAEPMKLELTANSVPWLEVEIKEITPLVEYELVTRTTRELKPGRVRGTLTFSTGLSREGTYQVPVTFDVLGRFHAEPRAIFANDALAGKPFQNVRLMYFGEQKEARVAKAEASVPGRPITVAGLAAPDTMWKQYTPRLTLTGLASFTMPDPKDVPPEGIMLRFTVDDASCPVAEVLITTDRNAFDLRLQGAPEQAAR